MFGDWWHHLESNFVTQYEVAKVVCSGLVLGCAEAEDERLRDNQPSVISHTYSQYPCMHYHGFHEETLHLFYIFIIFTFSHQTSVAV